MRSPIQLDGQDSILYDGVLSGIESNTNIGRAEIYGLSSKLRLGMSKLSFSASYTFLQGRDLENENALRHVSPSFGSARLQYTHERFNMAFYTNAQGAIALEELAPVEQGKAHIYSNFGANSWYTLNVMAGYRIGDFVSIHAGVENLLDAHYRPYSWGLSAPGRNVFASFRFKY